MADQTEKTKEDILLIPEEEYTLMSTLTLRLGYWAGKNHEMFTGKEHTRPCAICGGHSKELKEECHAAMKEFELERHAATEGIAKRILDKWMEVSPFFIKSLIEIRQIDHEYDERYLKRLSKMKKEIEKHNADTTMLNRTIGNFRQEQFTWKRMIEKFTEYLEKKKVE